MVEEPIEESYFNWLCAKVLETQSRNYRDLLRILNNTEFVWKISGDQNRYYDGIELREEFLTTTGIENDEFWFTSPCSILEMLISFSRRANFEIENGVEEWFWTFITNLRLDYKRVTGSDESNINDILYNFVWRLYEPSGDGGMFPMLRSPHDQRNIEIWYQFCEYLDDHDLLSGLI